ncbi:MAG: thioredoxin domain-containing protein [Epsilonproteobacteria bacterium]|nr:MAG: thioredoxin domain-containing protein [Campylobacterota bacterium]
MMEEESFTDEDIARKLNKDYVSIKVDREEFPQIDKKYQRQYFKIKGKRGGWPLSVFMTPEREVFHLATYIPTHKGYGSRGMHTLLSSFVKFEEKELEEQIKKHQNIKKDKGLKKPLSLEVMEAFLKEVSLEFDEDNGGFSSRPKFPEASKLAVLMDIYKLTDDKRAFEMVDLTLTKMAKAGIYDQIWGGFFRYTTDKHWQNPHFEKMLYTNAELIAVYAEMYLLTKKPLYKKVVDESISQIEKIFMKEGLYLSASDADSDGKEGGYFIYDYLEIKSDLKSKSWKEKDIEEVLAYLGIEEDGNIDGDLSLVHITGAKIPKRLEEAKVYLRSVSEKRNFPFVDKKVITAWNAMMIKALFVAEKIDNKYLYLAEKRLEALLHKMRKKNVLYHQALLGKQAKQEALLEDYAFLMDALIEGYLITYNTKYLNTVKLLAKESLAKFYRKGVWYLSNDGIKAEADFDDRHYSAALSVMLENLLKLMLLNDELGYFEIVKNTLKKEGNILEDSPNKASRLVHTLLRLELGSIAIKSSKEKLIENKGYFALITYPFLLSKAENSNEYLACTRTSCFAHDKNITKVIEQINQVVKHFNIN